ncbi:unnamed protein product [Urochloa humidicola]
MRLLRAGTHGHARHTTPPPVSSSSREVEIRAIARATRRRRLIGTVHVRILIPAGHTSCRASGPCRRRSEYPTALRHGRGLFKAGSTPTKFLSCVLRLLVLPQFCTSARR